MGRFIIVTFAFLGWVFYEMSGGADFDPQAARLTNVKTNPLAPAQVQTATLVDESRTAQLVAARNEPQAEVTRLSLNLTTVGDVTRGRNPFPQQDAASSETETQGDSVTIIPSLVAGAQPAPNAAVAESAATKLPATDLRKVKGNRVNVRGGPGKDYSVVSRLTRGTEVEILQDPGNGWVKLRPSEGGAVGWMADFLLTSG